MEPHEFNTLPHPTGQPATPPSPAGRFLYASGTRPLAGYTIRRGVGQGGFGEIYYATSDAGKDVALKLIRRNLDVELRGIRQCLNLKHPNLIDLYDIRQDEHGDTWVVMEYVADPSLEVVLADRPSGLPPQEALWWIHGVGAGVAYLHDRGIVHRDLKPGNIFRDEGVVKVGDYGLSKFISCSRRSGHTESVGTVHYMAPEVANGRYGKELDVYALGVILYELLTGRVPFEGESVGEVLMKHLTARPDVSMIAEPYRGVIARALEKDPELRYRSASEMMAALPTPMAQNGLSSGGAMFSSPMLHVEPFGDSRKVDANCIATDGAPAAKPSSWHKNILSWREGRPDKIGLKMSLLGVALIVLVVMAHIALPWILLLPAMLLIFVGGSIFVGYGGYRIVRGVMFPARVEPAPVNAPPQLAGLSPQPRVWPRYGEKPLPAHLVASPRERLAQLLGSMLTGSLAVAAMSVVMVLVESYRTDAANSPRPEQFAWLVLVSLAGTWAVLIVSKFWEVSPRGDPMLRRFLLMAVGLALGATAFGLAQVFFVQLPSVAGYPKAIGYRLPPNFYAFDGQPLLMAYAACFGTLFLAMRWWRQAEPMRPARLSVWSLVVSVLVAALVAQVWQFPQPWLPMVAGTMSVAVQLAAPWRRSARRKW